jgi:cytochrome c553
VQAGEPAPAPPADPAAAPDPAAVAAQAELAKNVALYKRGKHLTESIGACLGCHGADLATPEVIVMGPGARIAAPNISMGGKLKEYSDAEMHRLLVNGVKKDGRSLVFMPAGDFRWWPDEDVLALIGYLRTMPAIDKPSDVSTVGTLGKVLDQTDKLPLTIARRVTAKPRVIAAAPAPTAEYGKNLAALCMGCHGPTLSGGPIPGAPPDLPIPLNITPHKTGIAHYDFAKFETLMRTAKKADGSDLNPFMPVRDMKHMSDVEMKALWAYLQTVPQKEFGGR